MPRRLGAAARLLRIADLSHADCLLDSVASRASGEPEGDGSMSQPEADRGSSTKIGPATPISARQASHSAESPASMTPGASSRAASVSPISWSSGSRDRLYERRLGPSKTFAADDLESSASNGRPDPERLADRTISRAESTGTSDHPEQRRDRISRPLSWNRGADAAARSPRGARGADDGGHLRRLCPRADAADRRRRPARRSGAGPARRRRCPCVLERCYAWLVPRLQAKEWAAGDRFTIADCAAAPALFYGDWVHPIPERYGALAAYRARLLSRPSVARVVDEARPYRSFFPLGAPDRD